MFLRSQKKKKKRVSFLFRMCEVYGRYLPKYADIIEPFAKLRKKNVDFIWTNVKQVALNNLKFAFVENPFVWIFNKDV